MNPNKELPSEIVNQEIILDNNKKNPTMPNFTPEYYKKIKEISEYIQEYMNLQMPTPCYKCHRILQYECIDCIEQK